MHRNIAHIAEDDLIRIVAFPILTNTTQSVDINRRHQSLAGLDRLQPNTSVFRGGTRGYMYPPGVPKKVHKGGPLRFFLRKVQKIPKQALYPPTEKFLHTPLQPKNQKDSPHCVTWKWHSFSNRSMTNSKAESEIVAFFARFSFNRLR